MQKCVIKKLYVGETKAIISRNNFRDIVIRLVLIPKIYCIEKSDLMVFHLTTGIFGKLFN